MQIINEINSINIIDSKTQGQLSQTCTSEDKPWIQSTEFDFNSVD